MSLVFLLTLSTRNSHSVFSLFYFFLFFFSFYSRKLGQWLFGRTRFRTLQKNQRMLERTNEQTNELVFKNYFGETYQLTSSFLSIYVPSNSTSYDIVLCIEVKGFSCKSLYKQVAEINLPFFSYSIICPLRKILRYLSFTLNYYDR